MEYPLVTIEDGRIRVRVNGVDVFDPSTGEVRHPLLLSREEKTVMLIVVSGDKGFAGGFNGNITKAAFRFLNEHSQQKIDIAPIGKKGRDLFRRRYGVAEFIEEGESDIKRRGGSCRGARSSRRSRGRRWQSWRRERSGEGWER